MPASLSDLAEQGLLRCFGETEKRLSYRSSIRLHLSGPQAARKSVRLSVSLDKELYLFVLGEVRLLWERREPDNHVWSATLHRPPTGQL